MLIDFTLYYSREFVFYRIFEGDDLFFWSVEIGEEGIEGGCFTASSWSCDEDGSVFFVHTAFDLTLGCPHESEITDHRDGLG